MSFPCQSPFIGSELLNDKCILVYPPSRGRTGTPPRPGGATQVRRRGAATGGRLRRSRGSRDRSRYEFRLGLQSTVAFCTKYYTKFHIMPYFIGCFHSMTMNNRHWKCCAWNILHVPRVHQIHIYARLSRLKSRPPRQESSARFFSPDLTH